MSIIDKESSIRFIKESFLNSDSEKQKKLKELLDSVSKTDENEIDEGYYSKLVKKVIEL